MTLIQFGDATEPRWIPFDHAALYAADCDYPCPPGADQKWPLTSQKRWITFNGDPHASCIDYEPGTACFANPQLITEWLNKRHELGLTRPAFIYSDLSNAESAQHHALQSTNYWMWWVATLDGIQRSAQELANLLTHWGAPTTQDKVAAHQWKRHDLYDSSHCFNGWL